LAFNWLHAGYIQGIIVVNYATFAIIYCWADTQKLCETTIHWLQQMLKAVWRICEWKTM